MRALLRLGAAPFQDEGGATAIEYALLAGLIAAVIVAMAALLGETVAGAFEAVNDALNAAQ